MPSSETLTPQTSSTEKTPWSPPGGTVEDMRSGNLQFYVPDLVENMQSGGLQHHPSPQYVEDIKKGGLQYESYSNKEGVPPPPPPLPPLPPIPVEDSYPEPPAKRKILGMSKRTFWLLAIAFVLITTGAIVGAVVGTQKQRQSNTTANQTGASPIPAVSTTVVITATSTTGTVTSSTTSAPSASTSLPYLPPSRANPVDVDGNYFVNCNSTQGGHSSGMAYYKNLVPGDNVGHRPDDYIDVTNGTYVTWENGGVVKFHSGVPLHWSTLHDAGVNQRAGTADNTYENFFVYQDSKEFLYSVGNWSCYSMYWAF